MPSLHQFHSHITALLIAFMLWAAGIGSFGSSEVPYGLKQEIYHRQSSSLPFAYNGAEEQNSFGLHLTTYRTMAPEVAMWGQVDPKASLMYGYTPHNSMGGNPVMYADPEGDVVHIAVGAVLGAAGNLIYQGINGKLTAPGDFFKAIGIGALAGGAAAATGGASLAAMGAAGSLGAAVTYGAALQMYLPPGLPLQY